MLAKPVGSHTQHLPLTIFLIVTSLALSTCRVTCGQGRQDQAKRDQVEGPLLNALQSQPTDTNAASVQLPTQLVAPYLSKFDIEVSTEALLKPATLPAAGVPNLITSLELPDTPSLESLFVGEDGKQPPKASPVPNPAMGAFSKAIIETPSKLLLDIPSVQPNQLLATLTANAPPNSTRDQSVGSTPARNNPTVQPGRVHWHADLATATAQSQRSGKPIFHFQLLGQLDQRFT